MGKPIKKGDLVVAVRGHSCTLDAVGGMPFIVSEVLADPQIKRWWCSRCNAFMEGPPSTWVSHNNANIPTSWLLKISPDALSSSKPAEKEQMV